MPKIGGIGVNPVITGRTEPGCNTMFIIFFYFITYKELIMTKKVVTELAVGFGKTGPEAFADASFQLECDGSAYDSSTMKKRFFKCKNGCTGCSITISQEVSETRLADVAKVKVA